MCSRIINLISLERKWHHYLLVIVFLEEVFKTSDGLFVKLTSLKFTCSLFLYLHVQYSCSGHEVLVSWKLLILRSSVDFRIAVYFAAWYRGSQLLLEFEFSALAQQNIWANEYACLIDEPAVNSKQSLSDLFQACEIKDSVKSTEAHIVSMRNRLSIANSDEEKRLAKIELERMFHVSVV